MAAPAAQPPNPVMLQPPPRYPSRIAKETYARADLVPFIRADGIDWPGVLQFIRERHGFTENKQLATYLDVPSSTLSALRRGRSELSTTAKYDLLDRFGYHLIAEAAELLAADDFAIKRRRASSGTAKHQHDAPG